MTKYVKKPIVIEAFIYGVDPIPEWAANDTVITFNADSASIETFEGSICAREGDYIIKGIKGEIFPCKAEIFKETYEAVIDPYVAKVGAGFKLDEKVWSQPRSIIPFQD